MCRLEKGLVGQAASSGTGLIQGGVLAALIHFTAIKSLCFWRRHVDFWYTAFSYGHRSDAATCESSRCASFTCSIADWSIGPPFAYVFVQRSCQLDVTLQLRGITNRLYLYA